MLEIIATIQGSPEPNDNAVQGLLMNGGNSIGIETDHSMSICCSASHLESPKPSDNAVQGLLARGEELGDCRR